MSVNAFHILHHRCASAFRWRAISTATIALALFFVTGCATGDGHRAVRFDEHLRASVFDRYWSALDEHYPFFEIAGVNWKSLRAEHRDRALAKRRRINFYHELAGMLAKLNDLHVSLDVSLNQLRDPNAPCTSAVLATLRTDNRLYLTKLPRGSVAIAGSRATLAARVTRELPRIVSIDGVQPAHGLLALLLAGPPNSRFALALEWADGGHDTLFVQRPAARRPALAKRRIRPAPRLASQTLRNGAFGYLRVPEFGAPDDAAKGMDARRDALDAQIDRVSDAQWVVLDLRFNRGGYFGLAAHLASRLTRKPMLLGALQDWGWMGAERRYDIEPRDPIQGTLIILVNQWTASSAEHLVAALQRSGQAIVIGRRTSGAEAVAAHISGRDGTVLHFSVARVTDENGNGIERVGIMPDRIAGPSIDVLRSHGLATGIALCDEQLLDVVRQTVGAQLAPRVQLPTFGAQAYIDRIELR